MKTTLRFILVCLIVAAMNATLISTTCALPGLANVGRVAPGGLSPGTSTGTNHYLVFTVCGAALVAWLFKENRRFRPLPP